MIISVDIVDDYNAKVYDCLNDADCDVDYAAADEDDDDVVDIRTEVTLLWLSR